ncbi:MAG: 3-methyl-2-oxobutanoate dehydrogenase subunit VorB, partial [Bacteroidota bacterium]|nr:3-methyl-2-oxobutanoate dehydrogenase subunit VorB [Bacteroidota bacterium]
MKEVKLMKGNEALAEAAIRCGCDAYFGYPITPQSEVLEYLAAEANKRTGMVVLQAESEVASINMVYGAGATGKRVMTSSSSPGISLMQEGISYIACAEIPCLVVNVVRGGPGLGTIQASQSDYFQAVKGGGHGDYNLIVLAPASVQEMVDHVKLGFELAFKYLNPVMILSDGSIGQMMEKVELFPQEERRNTIEPWATTGKTANRERNIITSLYIESEEMEQKNLHLQRKYREIEKNEIRYQMIDCDDADYILTAYGLSARICQKVAQLGREKGIKIGVFRPITLFPFPYQKINELA